MLGRRPQVSTSLQLALQCWLRALLSQGTHLGLPCTCLPAVIQHPHLGTLLFVAVVQATRRLCCRQAQDVGTWGQAMLWELGLAQGPLGPRQGLQMSYSASLISVGPLGTVWKNPKVVAKLPPYTELA